MARIIRGMRTGRAGLLVLAIALVASIPVIAIAQLAPGGVEEGGDPARNTPLACDVFNVPGAAALTRSAKNIEHRAQKCGIVGVEIEFQSRRDAKGKTRDYAFMSTMGAGLRIYDITNPREPFYAGGFDNAGWQNDIQVRGNIVAQSFDGVSGEASTSSLCLKSKYPDANDQGVDFYRLAYNPTAAASGPLGADPLPSDFPNPLHTEPLEDTLAGQRPFVVTNPTCIANPSGGAHNSTINPRGDWLEISNCCSDWAADVIDMRPVTTGPDRTELRTDPTAFAKHRYRLIDGSRATPDRCEGRANGPGPVTCIVMQRPASPALGSDPATVRASATCVPDRAQVDVRANTPCGLWRPHDAFFSRDGRTMYVAALNSTRSRRVRFGRPPPGLFPDNPSVGNGGRLLVVLGAVALAIALFFVVRAGGDDDGGATTAAQPTTTAEETTSDPRPTSEDDDDHRLRPPPPPGPQQVRFVIPEGGPTGIQRVRITQGDRVVLTIRSAVSDHAHLHGYDLITDVGPSQPARISFRADVPGRFEIELEDAGQQFGELTVAP